MSRGFLLHAPFSFVGLTATCPATTPMPGAGALSRAGGRSAR